MKRNCMNPCLTDGSLMEMKVKVMKMMKMSQSITEQREKRGEKRKKRQMKNDVRQQD